MVIDIREESSDTPGTPSKSLAYFKNLKLFTGLSDADLKYFSDAAKIKHYKKGQMLFNENDAATSFYVICSGWLKLFHTTPEGEEMVLGIITNESIAGAKYVGQDYHFAISAQVIDDAEIISMPLALLKERLHKDNQLARNMLAHMIEQKYCYEQQLIQYVLYSAPQRIGCFLLGLCAKQDLKDGVIINLPYDKVLIASSLWMKAPTFSRALNILREETNILITGTTVTIDSIERLRAFVGGCYAPPQICKI